MDTVTFFEQLALNVHHREVVGKLIGTQAEQVQLAVKANDGEKVKRWVAGDGCFANEDHVFQI